MNRTQQNFIRQNLEYLVRREDGDMGSTMTSLTETSRFASIGDSTHTGDSIVRAHNSIEDAEAYFTKEINEFRDSETPDRIVDLVSGETRIVKTVARAGDVVVTAFSGVGAPDLVTQRLQASRDAGANAAIDALTNHYGSIPELVLDAEAKLGAANRATKQLHSAVKLHLHSGCAKPLSRPAMIGATVLDSQREGITAASRALVVGAIEPERVLTEQVAQQSDAA